MARAPFKLRSGNTSSFKNLGSSPAKQDNFEKEYEKRIGSDAYADEEASRKKKESNERATVNFEKEYERRIGSDAYAEEMAGSNKKQDTDTNRSASIKPDKKKHEFPPETNPIESIKKTRDKTIQETKPNHKGTELPQPVRDTKGTNEGKLKKTGKKRPTINVPKGHSVTPPTDKQSKKSKGTVKGLTNFEYDMKPVTNVINKTNSLIAKPYKKVGKEALELHKKINPIATYKKVKKYFTEK